MNSHAPRYERGVLPIDIHPDEIGAPFRGTHALASISALAAGVQGAYRRIARHTKQVNHYLTANGVQGMRRSMSKIPKVRVRACWNADPNDARKGVCLFIFRQEEVGKGLPSYPLKGIAFESKGVKPGGKINPAIVLPTEEAQALFDDLWKAGLRPPADQMKPVIQAPIQLEADPSKYIPIRQAYENLIAVCRR